MEPLPTGPSYHAWNKSIVFLDGEAENKVILTLPSTTPVTEHTKVHKEDGPQTGADSIETAIAIEAQAEDITGWMPLPPG